MSLSDVLDIIPDNAVEKPFEKDSSGYNNSYYVGRQIMSYYKQKILFKINRCKKWIKKKQHIK